MCPVSDERKDEEKMTEKPQWHVFYRTMGMAARNEKGWARADILADTKEAAVRELRSRKHRVQHIRVYPGAAAWVAEFRWEAVTLETKHEPHSVTLTAGPLEQLDRYPDVPSVEV